ncbi:hypothetical protein P691DRAFT_258112 [Macrolepiota fuliginosa MF-IS2]|uniref:DUF6533 domain-containing protein n=1 Tax=Macrolepiota fuliginosa MF-IS2 TaxID=1400762 RepID=A0A9P5XIR3_9AGAR|nr:hypothetical protein P691DRAFT_258112 [Macrolepiota fuliginosa MF-IS2]
MDRADLIQAVRDTNVVRICQLIPAVVTLYDHFITLDQEIALVWKRPCSFARSLFLWNRYFGSFFLLTDAIMFAVPPPPHDNVSRLWFIFQGCGTAIIIWSMQCTMLFRTWAMYPYSQYIRYAALLSFICEVLAMAGIIIAASVKFQAHNSFYLGYSFCTPHNVPSFLFAFWIPVIALDCVYFVLVAWLIVKRRDCNMHGLAAPKTIWETLMRDSISYFIVTLLTYVANAVIWIVLPSRWAGLPQAFSVASTCIMGVRLVLNLRGNYYCHSMGGARWDGVSTVCMEASGSPAIFAASPHESTRVSSSKIDSLSHS